MSALKDKTMNTLKSKMMMLNNMYERKAELHALADKCEAKCKPFYDKYLAKRKLFYAEYVVKRTQFEKDNK